MANLLKTNVAQYGLTQLIQRLGRDCTPTQFLREFTMNSIEAVQRTGKKGRVVVDFNINFFNVLNTHKMCFTDNGDGMTCEEMREHLNNLSSSGQATNVYENYGMGAKIASLTRNHAGIVYDSWKNGNGNRIWIHYDEEEKAYGIKPVTLENGTVEWCIPLSNDTKPKEIDQHGTRVTLVGMNKDQDTMIVPDKNSRGGRENWIHQYLNTRFFELNEDVELLARTGYYRDPSNKRHNCLRRVHGQKATLHKHAEQSGSVRLSDSTVHWWILKKDRSGHGREYVSGHTGSLNQNELFDIADGRSNRAPAFGVIFGKEDVVLYVEPASGYVQNTSRTCLVQKDGSQLPWNRWQDEFRDKMPQELADFVKNRMNASANVSHEASIRDRLKSVASFFNISRYRKTTKSDSLVDPTSEVTSKTGHEAKTENSLREKSTNSTGDVSGVLDELLLSTRADTGVPAKAVKPNRFPDVRWKSEKDGTRAPDELDDRAACYLEKDNLIIANADFQGITDIIEHFAKQYTDIPEIENIIREEVQEAFEQQLVETVTGALTLRNRPRWNPDQFNASVSEEALTAAVMSRYHLINHIKRQINKKLGRTKVSAAQ